jgi:hypothetical protein
MTGSANVMNQTLPVMAERVGGATDIENQQQLGGSARKKTLPWQLPSTGWRGLFVTLVIALEEIE